MFRYLLLFHQPIDRTAFAVILLFILIIQALIVFFPKDAFMVYVGIVFGTFGGGVINLIGLVGASWLGYELGSSGLFRVERVIQNPKFLKCQQWIKNNGMKALIISRLIPVMQYNLVSLTSGFTKLKRAQYLLINFIAAIPYAFMFAYIGSKGLDIVLQIVN